jgi:hypothetical protein
VSKRFDSDGDGRGVHSAVCHVRLKSQSIVAGWSVARGTQAHIMVLSKVSGLAIYDGIYT